VGLADPEAPSSPTSLSGGGGLAAVALEDLALALLGGDPGEGAGAGVEEEQVGVDLLDGVLNKRVRRRRSRRRWAAAASGQCSAWAPPLGATIAERIGAMRPVVGSYSY
jgi:hypothetical protein